MKVSTNKRMEPTGSRVRALRKVRWLMLIKWLVVLTPADYKVLEF